MGASRLVLDRILHRHSWFVMDSSWTRNGFIIGSIIIIHHESNIDLPWIHHPSSWCIIIHHHNDTSSFIIFYCHWLTFIIIDHHDSLSFIITYHHWSSIHHSKRERESLHNLTIRRWRGAPLLARRSSTMARCSAARSSFDDGAVFRCSLVGLRDSVTTSLDIASTS